MNLIFPTTALDRATPRQPKGPFYPGPSRLQTRADLTGSTTLAPAAIFIRGRVHDLRGVAIPNATVEIWQACASGKYDHPDDPNEAPIDPDFGYCGQTQTRADGSYVFKTIIPGAYPADAGWMRPPHVHFRVTRDGYVELITQMYFAGHALNEIDQILQMLSETERAAVVIRREARATSSITPPTYEFNLALIRVRADHRSKRTNGD